MKLLMALLNSYWRDIADLDWRFDWSSNKMRRRTRPFGPWETRDATDEEHREALEYWGDTAAW